MEVLKLGSAGLVSVRKKLLPAWRQECAECVWGYQAMSDIFIGVYKLQGSGG